MGYGNTGVAMNRDPGTFTAECTRCGAQFLDDFTDARCPRCRKLRIAVRDWLALAPEDRPAVTYRGDPVIGVVGGDDTEAGVKWLPTIWIITDRGTATATYGASRDTELDTSPA